MSAERPTIHIISTVNGQTNEGMRNVATHIGKTLEASYTVRYSGLKDVGSILKNSRTCDVTLIFARANRQVYLLARAVSALSRRVWLVCVQKPDADFAALTRRQPLRAGYLTLLERDLKDVRVHPAHRAAVFSVGIDAEKFRPADDARRRALKAQWGFDAEKPLVVHVGHCSAGRGLETLAAIPDAEKLVVASGMFESAETVEALTRAGVRIHRGYLERVETVYQMADVYLFPTRSAEYVISVPLSVLEALSCGVPVVGFRDFENLAAIPAQPGAVMLVDDASALADAVQRARAGRCAHSLLTCPQTWAQTADAVIRIIKGEDA